LLYSPSSFLLGLQLKHATKHYLGPSINEHHSYNQVEIEVPKHYPALQMSLYPYIRLAKIIINSTQEVQADII